MLSRILDEIRCATGPISVRELSQKLDVQPSALEGMLLQLMHMGKLEAVTELPEGETCSTCSGCAGANDCPFIFRSPQRFRLPGEDEGEK